MHHKKTFKEFVTSDEGIASNLLASRLKLLESLHIITKRKLPTNKKENIYLLTEKGMDLAPMILEIARWSDTHVRVQHPDMNSYEPTSSSVLVERVQKEYSVFASQVIDG